MSWASKQVDIRGESTRPSSAALDQKMTAWRRGCKACHRRKGCGIPLHRGVPCVECNRFGHRTGVPVTPRHRSEHPRLISTRKPQLTRGQMTSRGGGQAAGACYVAQSNISNPATRKCPSLVNALDLPMRPRTASSEDGATVAARKMIQLPKRLFQPRPFS